MESTKYIGMDVHKDTNAIPQAMHIEPSSPSCWVWICA